MKLFTEGLHSELKNTGIYVSVDFPGAIDTEISMNSGVTPPEIPHSKAKNYKRIPPQRAAEAIVKGIE